VLAVRYLGQSAEAARDYFATIWSIARPALIGTDAVAPRLWST
jgi:urease accessory protein UreH